MPDFLRGIKAAISSLLGQSSGEDAVTMLVEDHRRVKEIFESFKDLDDAEKNEAKHKALVELALHAACEEKLVYPLLREEGEDDEVDEAFEEHHVVKLLILELEAMTETNAKLDAKFKVLGEIVDHHVKEEESEMFPKLRSSENDLVDLGEKIKAMKEELLAKLGENDDLGLIDPELARHPDQNGNGYFGYRDGDGHNGNNYSNGRKAAGSQNSVSGKAAAKKSSSKSTKTGSKAAANVPAKKSPAIKKTAIPKIATTTPTGKTATGKTAGGKTAAGKTATDSKAKQTSKSLKSSAKKLVTKKPTAQKPLAKKAASAKTAAKTNNKIAKGAQAVKTKAAKKSSAPKKKAAASQAKKPVGTKRTGKNK